MKDLNQPLKLEFKKAAAGSPVDFASLSNFTSYSFDRSILTPAAAFRFTAPGVDKKTRLTIRSGDNVRLFCKNNEGTLVPIATGIVDETDTHVTAHAVDYVITGRDALSQLVDNATVDSQNNIVNIEQATIRTIVNSVISNTRLNGNNPDFRQTPEGNFLFNTQPGETKLNSLQRSLDVANCLVWMDPNGRMIVGKPNFTSPVLGSFIVSYSASQKNNVIEARVRRGANLAIRQIVYQLQTHDQVKPGPFTKTSDDKDLKPLIDARVGRSVYNTFTYGGGTDGINQILFVGNTGLSKPEQVGAEMCLRTMARENMKIIDVECVVQGHVNGLGQPYNIDQIYDVRIEDEDLNEPMYVYQVSYELTQDHGMMTHLKLCRKGTIVSQADALPRKTT